MDDVRRSKGSLDDGSEAVRMSSRIHLQMLLGSCRNESALAAVK